MKISAQDISIDLSPTRNPPDTKNSNSSNEEDLLGSISMTGTYISTDGRSGVSIGKPLIDPTQMICFAGCTDRFYDDFIYGYSIPVQNFYFEGD